MENKFSSGQGIQSIEKASLILDKIKEANYPTNLTALSKDTDISKNNLKKYLVSFVRTGFLVFDDTNKTYNLGPKLISLGLNALNQLDIFSFIDSYITKIKNLLNKPVALAIWGNQGPVISRYQKSNKPVNINIEIGYSPPLLVSSVGKCFAAFASSDLTKEIMVKEMKEFDLDKQSVEKDLSDVYKTGYSFRDKEYEHIPGNRSISAPVFDVSGNIIAVICVLGFTNDLDTNVKSDDVQTLQKITEEVSFNSIYKQTKTKGVSNSE